MTSDPCEVCGGTEFRSRYTNFPMRYASVCLSCGNGVECNLIIAPKPEPKPTQPSSGRGWHDEFGNWHPY
ncbi:hypothetical protein UFOVP134_44 [uncultured Caudovirales phage]|uniref:Uncharacterized protein n=1 Tax=uncultured Caudovirales phage TaxID=2100421 RepID=A0A6J5LGC9_9CAUD|nr:hypothetical protein UFOVP134_44 [uncultured Caudovirales phage]